MSDLREAQLRQEFRAEIMRGYQAALCNSDVPGWTLGDEVAKVADNLLASVAASPARGIAEGGGITDEAVEAAARAIQPSLWDESDPASRHAMTARDDVRIEARAALEAALPLLGLQQVPTVLLDREAVLRAIVAASEPEGSDCILGREYVENYADVFVDAVMELAQQVPSREEIEQAVATAGIGSYRTIVATAVLALFSKPAEEPAPECDCRYGHNPAFTKHEHTCSWGRWHLVQEYTKAAEDAGAES